MMNIRALFAEILAFGLLGGAISEAGTVYDAAADFSATTNPNGVWSYGWSLTLGSTFNLDVATSHTDGIDAWDGPFSGAGPNGYPAVGHNSTTSTITIGTDQFQPGQLWFHPGPADQYGVIRFTAPAAGSYALSTSFVGIDLTGTTTDVHVLVNGSSILSGPVDGFGAGSGPSFSTTLTLSTGDTVNFAVGYGSNGYFFDGTGISATLITSLATVPEPGSVVLLSLGFAGLAVLMANRKNRHQ